MNRYELKIELLSDLCVSDGGVYNSALDIDICQDRYGFPYIPAKRIKGCLRESALELKDWNIDIPIDEIFGNKGEKSNGGKLKISDAVLDDRKNCMEEIANNPSDIYNHNNVLAEYSYIRTQTAIDKETGTAKEHSLRTMRVAKKGLVFSSVLELEGSENNMYTILKMVCANLKHMGNSRTRGLGEVKVTIGELSNNILRCVADSKIEADANVLEYELFLEEPMICKSLLGGESNSLDYIEGSKIIGLVAERCKSVGKNITDILDQGDIKFSNVYIADKGIRYTEVPGYIYGIKNVKTSYINKLYDRDNKAAEVDGEIRQLNAMKHTYVNFDRDNNLSKMDVLIEQRYHHRRADDKSIGRASNLESSDSAFYQLSSIAGGQSFKGYIKGTNDQIKEIYALLKDNNTCRMGYGNSAEYGKTTIEKLVDKKEAINTINTDKVVVNLVSPTIVYNNKAMYSTDVDDLVQEVVATLGIDASRIESVSEKYISYVNVGGFNVTWNKRKPTIVAFDKGTSIVIKLKSKCDINVSEYSYVGERNLEGFGECFISGFDNSQNVEFAIVKNKISGVGNACIDLKENKLANKISNRLFKEYYQYRCTELAKKFSKEKNRATVSNMLLMCEENTDIEGVKSALTERYGEKIDAVKAEKNKIAQDILSCVIGVGRDNNEEVENSSSEKLIDKLKNEFANKYNVKNLSYEGDLERDILYALLQKIKYSIRALSANGKEENVNE